MSAPWRFYSPPQRDRTSLKASLSVEVRCARSWRQASLRTSSTRPPVASQQSMVPWASRITWTTRHNLHPAQSSLISARRPQADASKASQFVRAYVTDLPELEPLLAKIQTPALVMTGRNDPIVPVANG